MNNKDTDHQMPPVALLRICRCNALVVGTNACPHCNAGWAEVEAPVTQYARVDPPAAPTEKWDKAGLKEACQRALKLGRTHQEMDIQLVLDMLLEIERLEASMSNG